ncbi:MAG: hypothetical protein NDI94_01260 [Candidatus Woesearchaeota archaeon]|nr:hypothetical protein [Candidatus Woesearchaeota archaeon]
MSLRKYFAWWGWLLEFSPLKYLGLFFMIAGPLFFIYLYIFQQAKMVSVILGSLFLFFIGFITWLNGWDPYETVIKDNMLYESLKVMKSIFSIIEWYKWLLRFSILKYIALSFMTLGPFFFIYQIIFNGLSVSQNMIYSAISFIIGIIIWLISWDPYS